MKTLIVVLAAAAALAASVVRAQGPAANPGNGTTGPTPPAGLKPYAPRLPFAKTPSSGAKPAAPPPASVDGKVYPSTAVLPGPTAPADIKPATIALPQDPIEPFLLTKENGPFMVMAKTFRGPDAERYALALVLELRRDFGLPAYILRSKDFPLRSNIRNVPPTAPPFMNRAQLTDPEKVRTYDEAVVLVGDEKTLDDSQALLHKVKKIQPQCLKEMPSYFDWRHGLSKALRTTNPFVPAQDLFPAKKKDPLIAQMNGGPFSIFKCPGHYSLQIAQFNGLATFNPQHPAFQGLNGLRKSPLATAAEDAEKLAAALAKTPEIKQTGQPVYVYHDRTSSRVLIGSFNAPNEPAAVQLRDHLLKVAVGIMDTNHDPVTKKPRRHGVDKMIVPAEYLTDVEPIKTQK